MRVETAKFNASLYTSAKDAAGADALFKADEGNMDTNETTFINILVMSVLLYCTWRSARLTSRVRSRSCPCIQGVVSGEYEYCQLLLSVFSAAEVEFVASASASGSGSVSVAAVWGGAAVCVTRLLALMKEKAGISSSGAVSGSTNECTSVAAITVATTAVSGEESSAALTKAGTAAMNRMYARYARESSSFESIPSSADIDAAAREIERVCTGARSDEAAAGVEDCGAAPPGLVALPHRV
ncbi:hypothetical protein PR003_g29197 [Phytophthora rubi]|uniref:Uncharacterized protein n=1 Tax=Phytophthora rubi TaxID=129364 RepID=A0A6A3HDR6_9STRA|nr:hypothetical protein PR001_g28036 [Phytophthora rubi]KAE9275937.1 hypothetical protein PR003_g29197 [Phytophthora rubi]